MLQESQNTLEDNAMTPKEMSKLVTTYKTEVEKFNTLVCELQKDCRHVEYDVKNVGATTFTLKNVCRCCQLDLGYPTGKELSEAGY